MKKILVLLFLLVVPTIIFGQAVEYMRNGECYLLIGTNDVKYRGVYRLNNPSGESDGNPINKKLFDPKVAYGIYVNLNREVFTFSENSRSYYRYDSRWKLRRLLKVPGGVGLFGAHCDTRKSFYVSTENRYYNENGQPVYTTRGPMGNWAGVHEDPTNVCWGWSGIVRPTIKEAKRWYFQKTHVYCDHDCWATYGHGDQYWLYFVDVDKDGYGDVPNGGWWQSRDEDPGNRPGNMFYWDRAYRKFTYYDLLRWKKPMGIWSSSKPIYSSLYQSNIDYIYDEIVKRSRISACLNVVCVNGSVDNSFSAQPKHVSIAMSPISSIAGGAGRTYTYSRTMSSTSDGEVKLNGRAMLPNSGNIRGSINDITAKWVGVSTQSSSEDFIYILGTNLIKAWLESYNIRPASLNITSVAVSDQWWLEGGIVYAYDKAEGAVYQFIRNDKAGNNTCKSTPRKISLDSNIDSINADGYGNLYFTRTTREPSASSGLDWNRNLSHFRLMSNQYGLSNCIAWFKQKIYKTVFCYELGASGYRQIGKVHIGDNIYSREFSVPTNKFTSDKNKMGDTLKTWLQPYQPSSTAENPSLVQVGVINVARPPTVIKPNGKLGVVDIVGIEAIDPSFKFLTDEVKQGLYTFRVENAPYWEGRNNIATPGKTKWEGDKNGNGVQGGFVSSLMNTSSRVESSPEVLYTWRIYKIQDAFGNLMEGGAQLVKEFTSVNSSSVTYYFRSGTYQITCSAKFKYYNYNSLPFGSTVNDILGCLRGPVQADAVAMDASINSENFPGLYTAIPAKTAVTVLRVNRQTPPPTGKRLTIQVYRKGADGKAEGYEEDSYTKGWNSPKTHRNVLYHRVLEDKEYNWRLTPDPDDVRVGRDYLYSLYNLPKITNNNMVPNTLAWKEDAPVQYEWTLSLTLPDGNSYPAQELSQESRDNTGTGDYTITLSQSFPTDPTLGKLLCKAYRIWEYQENDYDDNGSYLGTKTVTDTVEYHGEVDIIVLDRTPPEIVEVNGKPFIGALDPILLGVTGGKATDRMSGEYGDFVNPLSFTILVRDNNIYANMNKKAPVVYNDDQNKSDCAHNRSKKQISLLSFERSASKALYPPSIATPTWKILTGSSEDRKHYSSPGTAQLADNQTGSGYYIKRTPIPYSIGDIYSYVLYEFKMSDWKHLQEELTDPVDSKELFREKDRWSVDFANNSAEYESSGSTNNSHKGYGVFFKAIDSSGIEMDQSDHIGNVWIRDNLAPIVYANIRDFIDTPEIVGNQPYGIDKLLSKTLSNNTKSGPLYGDFPSLLEWSPQSNGNYNVSTAKHPMKGIPLTVKTREDLNKLKDNGGIYPGIIQQGMEVFIYVKAVDNTRVASGTLAEALPSIIVNEVPNSFYSENDGLAAMAPEASGGGDEVRLMLHKSGLYKVTLYAEDTAKDFHDVATPNKRTVTFGLLVGPTRMEIRVLDKKNDKF